MKFFKSSVIASALVLGLASSAMAGSDKAKFIGGGEAWSGGSSTGFITQNSGRSSVKATGQLSDKGGKLKIDASSVGKSYAAGPFFSSANSSAGAGVTGKMSKSKKHH